MLLVYCENITARTEYVFQFILKEINGIEFSIVTDKTEFVGFRGAKINYSQSPLSEKELHIIPSGFLQATSVNKCSVLLKSKKNEIEFYIKGSEIKETIFDPFSASFYLISRYEEYMAYKPDEYGRFEATSSILYQNGLLERPLVDEWAHEIKKQLLDLYPSLPHITKTWQAIVSIDIDQAYAFKFRGRKRNFLSFAKNCFKLQKDLLVSQVKTLLFNKPDPFDTYEYLRTIQSSTRLPFLFFINMGVYSAYDKNLPPFNKNLKNLLLQLQTFSEIGLHPSYYSNEQPGKFNSEKRLLESILSHPITKSRQHYLKLFFPKTYRYLLAVDITEDYSMGFASHPGFRAGTCTPFNWFDIEQNCVTPLKVFPITFMDGTLGEDLRMSSEIAQEKIKQLVEIVKRYNGCFLSVWHNHTVNDQFFWKGWKMVFETSVQLFSNK